MTKRFAAMALAGGLLAALAGIGETDAAQRGRGNQGPPAPCGPKADLPPEFSNNVAEDSRCFEIRMYTVDQSRVGQGNFEGGIDELHQRFREKEVELFEKHGAVIVGNWQSLENPNTLIWMLAYRDRAHREQVFSAFRADPEWKELLAQYPVPIDIQAWTMSAADYSNMK